MRAKRDGRRRALGDTRQAGEQAVDEHAVSNADIARLQADVVTAGRAPRVRILSHPGQQGKLLPINQRWAHCRP